MELEESRSDFVSRIAEIAGRLDTGSVHDTLQRTVDIAVEVIPGCQHAGITIVHGRKITTPAASDAIALLFDVVQSETGEGPCLNAIAHQQTVVTDDLSREDRWPRFAARAYAETGLRSIVAVQLFARERTLGALNLLSAEPAAFNDDAVSIGALFASLAGIALNAAQKEEGLNVALKTRDVIGRAKGILIERHKIDDDAAFQRLVEASQHLNIRLADVADMVVFAGTEPGDYPAPPGT